MRASARGLIVLLVLFGSCQRPLPSAGRVVVAAGQGVVADSAMVVSAHPLATAIGVQVLRDGGHAVDAAVAVHWALAVVAPWAGNIGGGGLVVLRSADGTVSGLDFRETAPAAAHRDMFLDLSGVPLPDRSRECHASVGVPGSVAGCFAMHDSLGRLPMARLVQPAIDLATNGFPLTALEAKELNAHRAVLLRASTRPSAYTARVPWSAGDTLRLPELAATLMRIRDGGPDGFYRGATAALFVEEMQRGNGLITLDDLASYRIAWRPCVSGDYRGYRVHSMGPPTSGGIILLQALHGMERSNVRADGWQSVHTVHRMVEAERRAFASRAVHLGDPGSMQVPFHALIDTLYIDRMMADIDPRKATPSDGIQTATPHMEPEHTTHFSVVDRNGNAVSCTTTLNNWYGSGVVVGGAGFVLNNEMDDFSIAPGVPNVYGLVGGEVNAIAPGKRMLSSMTPTIVTKGDELFMVLGSPGGATIPASVLQTIMNVVDHGMGMQEAVAAPRFHHQWLPDVIWVEAGAIAPADSLALVAVGHAFKVREPMGRVDAILRLPDGRWEGGADPRGDDTAGGY